MIEFNNVKIFTDNIDQKALSQLHELDKTGVFADSPIRIMPDCHAGAGCVIGFTAPVTDKIIPNLVGVDIGCGMLCVELEGTSVNFDKLDKIIRKNIPYGRDVGSFTEEARDLISQLRCKKNLAQIDRLECSLGSLGGGNHFIEIDGDGQGKKYLIIHTGSRNLGKQVAEYYQDIAVHGCNKREIDQLIEHFKAEGRQAEIEEALKGIKKLPKDLCYLQGEAMEDYLHDMLICAEFADANRKLIAHKICVGLCERESVSFTTRHNYIGEDRIIRKGAICADFGKRVLIPLNMRDGCIIGIGKGNADWNNSAPHGAGRRMSRAEAKQKIDLDKFKFAMKGVYSTTVGKDTIDEAPFAYKPSEEIIELVQETVDIEKIIKPIYNFKAAE